MLNEANLCHQPAPPFRARVASLLAPPSNSSQRQRVLDYFLHGLIFLNFQAFIWGTVPWVAEHFSGTLDLIVRLTIPFFALEYILRLWCCVEHKSHEDSWRGRLQWLLSPLAIIDGAVLLSLLFPLPGVDLRFLRVVRNFRLMKYIRSRRYWEGVLLLKGTYLHARDALTTAFLVFLCFLHTFSILMYLAERHIQPEVFDSIPRTMWWACVTLTTVGYGDVTPVTDIGRIIATIAAFTGVAMLGVPAGVIAAGLVEEWNKLKERRRLSERFPASHWE